MQIDIEEWLASSPAATHASRSVPPANGRGKKTTATSGLKCFELSKSAGRLGSLLKTLLVTYEWAWIKHSLTWKPQVTPEGRLIFRLVRSARRTKGKGSGLWPTITVGGGGQTLPAGTSMTGKMPNGVKRTVSLEQFVNRVESDLWPTPRAGDADKRGNFDPTDQRNGLPGAVRLWPTPIASDSKGVPTQKMIQERLARRPTEGVNLSEEIARAENHSNLRGGILNPMWVEWLMGYPLGWTDREPGDV